MAAAGLGNAFSDVAGIGLAHHIEYFCSKLTNEPVLTSEQFSLPIVSWFIIIVIKSVFIFFVLILNMEFHSIVVFLSRQSLYRYLSVVWLACSRFYSCTTNLKKRKSTKERTRRNRACLCCCCFQFYFFSVFIIVFQSREQNQNIFFIASYRKII